MNKSDQLVFEFYTSMRTISIQPDNSVMDVKRMLPNCFSDHRDNSSSVLSEWSNNKHQRKLFPKICTDCIAMIGGILGAALLTLLLGL